ERIVGRDAIERAARRAVDVDADELAAQRVQTLGAGDTAAVVGPHADIERTGATENNVAAVVMDVVFDDPEDDALGSGIQGEPAVSRGEFRKMRIWPGEARVLQE